MFFNYMPAAVRGVTTEKRKTQLIVSLTSFPARIGTVHLAINTLLQQTVKPDRVILWLADSQFPAKEDELPENLLKLRELGLEIKWCEDIKSYKKLVPALREFPDDIIVTADDDILYVENWLESLYSEYQTAPELIYARRGRRVYIDNNTIKQKDLPENAGVSFQNRIAGGSGCLFPPGSLYKDIFNHDLIMNLIPTHDDVFFWAMGVLNDRKIKMVKSSDNNIYAIPEVQKYGLCKINRKGSSGLSIQEAYDKIAEKYPEIIEKLK